MNPMQQARNISWFGKLPCVGDFCSRNMSAYLLDELDDWLSVAMQTGEETHGPAWRQAYFETPIHGFVWGPNTLPALGEEVVVGVLMPSVDKAGREFPFVLLEELQGQADSRLPWEVLSHWFFHAHTLCADALNEEWPLDKFHALLSTLPEISTRHGHGHGDGRTLTAERRQSHWFRIDCAGEIRPVMQHPGLPQAQAFATLLGLATQRPATGAPSE